MTRQRVSDPIWIPPYSSPEEPWGSRGRRTAQGSPVWEYARSA
jgi:hypothetical protein